MMINNCMVKVTVDTHVYMLRLNEAGNSYMCIYIVISKTQAFN